MKRTGLSDFIELSEKYVIIDVRSELEFDAGHIPGAVNVPILNDEERKAVGTMYKQQSREAAVFKGLELSGPYLKDRLKKVIKVSKEDKVLVHCWRGGMRSEFMSFLIGFYGFEPIVLNGGYKTFRQSAHDLFDSPIDFRILGGKTGTGKTEVLKQLKVKGAQVIDLEGLAKHRGSSFGSIGMGSQPTQEQFENNLYDELRKMDLSSPVWIENENRTIGDKVIPEGIWKKMIVAKRYVLEKSDARRLEQIVHDYGSFEINDLIVAMQRIGKRLGPQHVKRAVEFLENGQIEDAFSIALGYYDNAYEFHNEKNHLSIFARIEADKLSHEEVADLIVKEYGS
jgi:tRNA 2-selenouridine synthase